MRCGVDQTILSYFKKDSNQRKISRYLAQIRSAIYIDFVPFYLGAKSRSLEDFLTHNTDSCIELYNLSKTDLVAVADGSYTRIEKSACNFNIKAIRVKKKIL